MSGMFAFFLLIASCMLYTCSDMFLSLLVVEQRQEEVEIMEVEVMCMV
jgi:hypothetical protein